MVWVVEKKIIRHFLDAGFERVMIPVRVKFEFEVKSGDYIPGTLTREILYNQKAIKNHYPELNIDILDGKIEKTVDKQIQKYLREGGFIKDDA